MINLSKFPSNHFPIALPFPGILLKYDLLARITTSIKSSLRIRVTRTEVRIDQTPQVIATGPQPCTGREHRTCVCHVDNISFVPEHPHPRSHAPTPRRTHLARRRVHCRGAKRRCASFSRLGYSPAQKARVIASRNYACLFEIVSFVSIVDPV